MYFEKYKSEIIAKLGILYEYILYDCIYSGRARAYSVNHRRVKFKKFPSQKLNAFCLNSKHSNINVYIYILRTIRIVFTTVLNTYNLNVISIDIETLFATFLAISYFT